MSPLDESRARPVCIGVIALLWVQALWASWECRGLYLDGSYHLLETIRRGGFLAYDFSPGRIFAIWISQLPVVAGLWLDIDDTHVLAQLYSLGLFALPTALYTMALWRAREDAVRLALVIAAVALVFQTTSFFIVGEFNTAYAIAVLTAVWVSTGKSSVRDGVVLVAVAAIAVRTYEAFAYLGPLLALLTVSRMAGILHAIAAALFVAAGGMAIGQLLDHETTGYLRTVTGQAGNFWWNLSFDLVLAATVTLTVWALLRPRDLAGWRPYAVAGVFVALLALSPMLPLGRVFIYGPLGIPQSITRTVAGPVTAVFCLLIWSQGRDQLELVPHAARRLAVFAGLTFVATLPWNAMLTTIYATYLQEVQATIRQRSGPVAFEQTRFASAPRLAQGDTWTLFTLSYVLRASPTDGVIQPPIDYRDWPQLPPYGPLDTSRFRWRD